MDILSQLNPEQREAVQHSDGPLLVVAGAGTGKTQVITRRIAYLINTGRARPGQVLALTFTEKAAREMEERLYDLIGWESFQVPIMTFHAFGTELLGRFAGHIGRSIKGGLINDTQKALLLQQHIARTKLEYFGPQADIFEFLEGIVQYIGLLQNAGIGVGDYERYVAALEKNPGDMHPRDVDEQRDLLALYSLYEFVKAEMGTFDYNDQLQVPLDILKERPNLATRLAGEYRYVLVDEYQDTNAVQDELLRTFVGPRGNIFAVGDDDQAIYGFRGADIGNILGFSRYFELDKPTVLVRNYRSGQAILDAAYRLIQNNNPERLEAKLKIDKHLTALHNESVTVFRPYRTPADELEGILGRVEERLRSGQSPANIAVLAATHAPLKALAKAMSGRGIAFALSTTVNIFEQPELIGLWHLMKWLVLQANEAAIGHVVMGPYIGWLPDRYRRLLETSRERMVTVEEALRGDTAADALELCRKLDLWRSWAKELPVSQLGYRLVFETGLAEKWQKQAEMDNRMVRVFEDLQRLLEQMQDYETVAIDTTLLSYLGSFPKPPQIEVSEPVGDLGGIQLLTVHASKGLEFDTVFLLGCSQRSWARGSAMGRSLPEGLRPASDLPPEHEYRRLMYVAVTRARRNLEVSASLLTNAGSKQAVSPFVAEMFGEEALKAVPAGNSVDKLQKVVSKLQRFYPMAAAYTHSRLPFEDEDGWLNLNVTALGRYDYCPFDFYLEHVLQIKQPLGPQMAFGSVLHRIFEAHYKGFMNGTPRDSKELHALLDEQWSDRGYERKDLADDDRALAHKTLDVFLSREAQASRKVLGSEVGIRFELPEARLRLRGKIDAFFDTPEGVELRDFKTGRTKTDPEKLAKEARANLQLRSYALAYELMNGSPPAQVVLDYVVTGVEGVASLSPTIMKNHRLKLAEMADNIRAREFAPNPSPAHICAAIRYYGTGERDELLQEMLTPAQEG